MSQNFLTSDRLILVQRLEGAVHVQRVQLVQRYAVGEQRELQLGQVGVQGSAATRLPGKDLVSQKSAQELGFLPPKASVRYAMTLAQ